MRGSTMGSRGIVGSRGACNAASAVRFFAVAAVALDILTPRNRRPKPTAARHAEPVPRVGSSTSSAGFVLSGMILSQIPKIMDTICPSKSDGQIR